MTLCRFLLSGILSTESETSAFTEKSSHPSNHQSAVPYSFKTLDDHADPTFNQLLGINNRGVIAGYFGSGVSGHPNEGDTAGFWVDGNGTPTDFSRLGRT